MITRGADYAVRALVHLATLGDGACVGHAVIAQAIGAPAPFVGKVVQRLAGAGLVVTRRGKGGGVSLAPRALHASMYDVICIVDGPPILNQCLSPDAPCERAAMCPAHLVWRQVQTRAIELLAAATIGRLAASDAARVERSSRPLGGPASDAM